MPRYCFSALVFALSFLAVATTTAADRLKFDAVSAEQAKLEQQELAENKEQRTLTDAMAEYRKTAEVVHYQSGERRLPGYLYKPAGNGPFPAVMWNHGSEKDPRAQPELARFYTQHGFVVFIPIRHGHGNTDGPYIVDLQKEIAEIETDQTKARREQVQLHDVYNADVVAALAWLKEQSFVDPTRLVVSGCSYGGIQTLITAEKGLGVKAFLPFAPGAMSFASAPLRERMEQCVKNCKTPMLLLQAQNDYSTGPCELLGPLLKSKGTSSHSTIYPAFGHTNQHGHGAFACWSLGTEQWGAEALAFIDSAFKH
ncbi:MAG TPA: prolyl oligopeptidase family serine peptidase [Pirellulaceae bacterium]|jgi:dienelactone hydrolase